MAKKLPNPELEKLPDLELFKGWVIGQKMNSKGEMVYAVGRYSIQRSRLHFNTREKAEEFIRLRAMLKEQDPAKDEVEETSETSDIDLGEVVDAITRWRVGFRLGVAIMLIIQYSAATNNIDNLEDAVDLLNHEIEQLRR